MLDFQAVRDGHTTFHDLVAGVTRGDLRAQTNEMIDAVLQRIAGCNDADVVFEPSDPQAYDPYAATPEEIAMPWTLGHLIVHITASSEESASLAAELARGVELHGRSRYEVPWQEVTTIEACCRRLEESRRMRLASLDMWPDSPHLETVSEVWPDRPPVNAVGRFVLGLMHADDHLGQIEEVVRQARQTTDP